MRSPISITYDPFDKFKGVYTPAILVYRTKIIYTWALNAFLDELPIRDIISHHYGYPLSPFGSKGKVTKDGVYIYPSDPDLYPIAVITSPKETIYCYEYEIIAIRNNDNENTVILRVD